MTGATRAELRDLERQIAGRDLFIGPEDGEATRIIQARGEVVQPAPLSHYETTLIRTALLALAERAP